VKPYQRAYIGAARLGQKNATPAPWSCIAERASKRGGKGTERAIQELPSICFFAGKGGAKDADKREQSTGRGSGWAVHPSWLANKLGRSADGKIGRIGGDGVAPPPPPD
jgi:hypothetical protein